MFLGKYDAVVGEKNRVTLPARIAQLLTNGQVVIGKGFENCIYGYELGSWEELTKQYLNESLLDPKARSVRRFIFSNSLIVPFDRQNRIVIPEFLKSYATIERAVTVVGSGDHFELWNESVWNQKQDELETIHA